MPDYFMKQPCKHCPFRKDVKPFLHPKRGEELAYAAANSYNTFACHKTTIEDVNSEDGNMLITNDSLECAGFLTLQIHEGATCPEGFTPSPLVYEDAWDMTEAYANQD